MQGVIYIYKVRIFSDLRRILWLYLETTLPILHSFNTQWNERKKERKK